MHDSLRGKTVSGIFWSSAERFSVQGIQFLVMLVIARILDPKDFGLIGMSSVFISIAGIFTDSGFSEALIRKPNRTEIDKNTVFYFNIVISFVLYCILFAIAPLVSDFYHEPQLTSLMRVLSLGLVIGSFSAVQGVLYTTTLDFRTLARATIVSTIISGVVGISMALRGFGVWALVWQQLTRNILSGLLLWYYSSWRPKMLYSWKAFKNLFAFGSNMVIISMMNTVYSNFYLLVVGKVFNATYIGYYTQADQISRLPSGNIHNIVSRVTFPVLSSIQNDNDRLKKGYRIILRLSVFIIFPLMCGLAGIAYPLIHILLGTKWDYTATLLIPLCFAMMWFPVHAINLNILKVKGRSDLLLRVEVVKRILEATILFITLPYGLIAMCYGILAAMLISLGISAYYSKRMIQIGILAQLRDISGILLISLIMFGLEYLITNLFANLYTQLVMGVCVGVIFFSAVVFFLQFKEVDFLKSIIKQYINNNHSIFKN